MAMQEAKMDELIKALRDIRQQGLSVQQVQAMQPSQLILSIVARTSADLDLSDATFLKKACEY